MSNDILCTLQLKSMSFQNGKIPKKRNRRWEHRSPQSSPRVSLHRCGSTAGSEAQLSRDRNDPKSGLASPNHTANLLGPVLRFIDTDISKQNIHFAACLPIYKICTLLQCSTAPSSKIAEFILQHVGGIPGFFTKQFYQIRQK